MTATAANEQPNPAPSAAPAQGATVLGLVMRILRKKWVWMPLLCLVIVGGLLWKFGPIVFAGAIFFLWIFYGDGTPQKLESKPCMLNVGIDPEANREYPGQYALYLSELDREYRDRHKI